MSVATQQTTETDSPKSLFAGLDSVRAFAAVAVVALHSCAPYLTHPMPGLSWPVRDSASPSVDFAFWSIELVVMPLFLVIAGFLAWQSLERAEPIAVVKNRAKRLLIPLLFGIIVVLPLDLYSWVLGWVTEGWVPPVKLRSLKFDGVIDCNLWGLSHLWFLHYLFGYIVILAIGKRFIEKLRHSNPVSLIAAWSFVAAIVVFYRPSVVWGFQHAFAPVPSKFVYHGMFFAVGVAVAIVDPRMVRLKSLAPKWVIPCVMLALATVCLGQWHLGVAQATADRIPDQINLAEATLAMATPVAAVALSLAIIGLAVARIRRLPVAVSYLAAASFWVYLVHHPLIGLVHIDLKWMSLGLSPGLKSIVACSIGLLLSMASYEVLVRRTAFGRLMGFAYQLPHEMGAPQNPASIDGDAVTISIDVGRRAAAEDASPPIPLERPRRAA